MAKVGYIRVSTIRQNTGRQEVAMPEDVRKVFIDHQSGKDTDRPSLKACFAFLREGDTLIVESISRFARNTRDLLSLVAKLQEMDVAFVSLKENIDTQTAQGRFMLTIFAACAELEREQILERQAEGIALAKAQGKYHGRTPQPLPDNFDDVVARWRRGEITAREAMRRTGLRPNTFYRKVRQHENV